MIDPITAVGLATSAYNAIKQGVAVGRELQDITGQLGKWGKAYSDFSFAEEQVKNPPWYSFKGSDTHSAIEIFAQKKKDVRNAQGNQKLHQFSVRTVRLGGSAAH